MAGDIDMNAVRAILDNCKVSEEEDCERLLCKQSPQVINKIFAKMYDQEGEENDFIPSGCTYDQLTNIILKEGGKKGLMINQIVK